MLLQLLQKPILILFHYAQMLEGVCKRTLKPTQIVNMIYSEFTPNFQLWQSFPSQPLISPSQLHHQVKAMIYIRGNRLKFHTGQGQVMV